MGRKDNRNFIFTLTDLLIGIILLGIVAGIVMFVVNPIEQGNRARDEAYREAASKLISERKGSSAAGLGFQAVKAPGSDPIFLSSVYACYVPSSESVRGTACKNGKVYTLNEATGERLPVPPPACVSSATWLAGTLSNSWVVCVPN